MEWKFEYLILVPLGWSLIQGIQQGKQIAVLQKTVDGLVTSMSLFLKTESDVLRDTLKENTRALQEIAKK